jgi:ABC-2 type transport system permease protein
MVQKLRRNQFLFEELVKREFKKKYKGTVLGMIWSLLSPLLTLLVMRVIFGGFFGSSVDNYTTYLFCGNLVFSYFNDSCSLGMLSLRNNADIFTKIKVPKFLFLLAKNVQTLINFAMTLAVFLLFCVLDGVAITWKFSLLLYPIICLLLLNIGVGLILSALFVFFRDMQYLWTVFAQLLMYASAIFYTTDGFSPWLRSALHLNPVYLCITYFRQIVLSGTVPGLWFHLMMLLYGLLALGIGCLIYKKYNQKFLYYL